MLRRTSTIFSFSLFFLLPTLLSSQLTIDVIAGINASRFTGSSRLYKLGPILGGKIIYHKTPRLKLGGSIQYIRKGYKRLCFDPRPCPDRKFIRTHANYLEFQPFIDYDVKKRFGIILGISFGILANQRSSTGPTSFVEKFDYGIIIGIKYDIDRFTLSFYRNQGINDVTIDLRAGNTIRSVSNQLVLAYRVFSKKRE